MSIGNQTWPGTLCVGTNCRAALPFNPALRDYFLTIAYPKPCERRQPGPWRCPGWPPSRGAKPLLAAGALGRLVRTDALLRPAACRHDLLECPLVVGPRGDPQADHRHQGVQHLALTAATLHRRTLPPPDALAPARQPRIGGCTADAARPSSQHSAQVCAPLPPMPSAFCGLVDPALMHPFLPSQFCPPPVNAEPNPPSPLQLLAP